MLSNLKPVSIGCWMATRTVMSSPFFASFGICTRASAMAIQESLCRVETRRLGHDNFRRRSPERTVGHGRNDQNRLCAVQADARGNLGTAATRVHMENRDDRPCILLGQNVDG